MASGDASRMRSRKRNRPGTRSHPRDDVEAVGRGRQALHPAPARLRRLLHAGAAHRQASRLDPRISPTAGSFGYVLKLLAWRQDRGGVKRACIRLRSARHPWRAWTGVQRCPRRRRSLRPLCSGGSRAATRRRAQCWRTWSRRPPPCLGDPVPRPRERPERLLPMTSEDRCYFRCRSTTSPACSHRSRGARRAPDSVCQLIQREPESTGPRKSCSSPTSAEAALPRRGAAARLRPRGRCWRDPRGARSEARILARWPATCAHSADPAPDARRGRHAADRAPTRARHRVRRLWLKFEGQNPTGSSGPRDGVAWRRRRGGFTQRVCALPRNTSRARGVAPRQAVRCTSSSRKKRSLSATGPGGGTRRPHRGAARKLRCGAVAGP